MMPCESESMEMKMSNQIAQTILEQLGGNRFAVMTGAKHFLADGNSLKFKLPGGSGFCKNGINYVVVTLEPSDTYAVEFYKIRSLKMKLVSKVDNVYCDQLQDVFTGATGLYTSLGNLGGQRALINGGQLAS